MMKLDIDRLTKKVVRFILTIPFPYKIRISAGGKGCHIVKDCEGCTQGVKCFDCWVKCQYDDKKRLKHDFIQYKNSIINNVLWRSKRGMVAGDWIIINSLKDIDNFLRDNARLLKR